MSTKPSDTQTAEVHKEFSQKFIPKDILWYPTYADRPDSYQADLMFKPVTNSKGQTFLQAPLCLINIDTKYAFAELIDYTRNVKKHKQRAWNWC